MMQRCIMGSSGGGTVEVYASPSSTPISISANTANRINIGFKPDGFRLTLSKTSTGNVFILNYDKDVDSTRAVAYGLNNTEYYYKAIVYDGTASSSYPVAINSDEIQYYDGSTYNKCYLVAWKN